MNYDNLTRQELIEKLEDMRILNKELLKEKAQVESVDLCWAGNLGHWYWNVKSDSVTFNHRKITNLGYEDLEIPQEVGYEFFLEKVHEEDRDMVIENMKSHLRGEVDLYDIEYKIKAKDGEYYWYYTSGQIVQYDEKGQPLLLSGIAFDISKRKELENSIREYNEILLERSMTDGLTDLNNCESIKERLNIEIALQCETDQPLSLAILDIDDFAKVNDRKGYVAGDKTLIEIAGILEESVRSTDAIGRYGGEEFLIIYPNTSKEEARDITERIRENIQNHKFEKVDNITVSGGVCQYKDQTKRDFIEDANTRLEVAKRQGKNQII